MTDTSPSKVEAAKDQASGLKDEALASGQHVAQTAADQAGSVVGEAKVQAKDLFGQAQGELREQAASQQKRVASGLRAVSDEFSGLADGSGAGSGMASDLVQQAADRAGSVASWLESRDPGTLLSDVRSYAARKPGTFIVAAAIAGIVAGRLTRSLAGNAKAEHDAPSTPDLGATSTTPVAPIVPVTPVTTSAAPLYTEPATVEPTFGTPASSSPLYSETASSGIDPTLADPTSVDPAYSDLDVPPVTSTHTVDDEYGDSSTVESLFDEPARPSFDETVQGDDYRGERS